jgi:hypothetical protein
MKSLKTIFVLCVIFSGATLFCQENQTCKTYEPFTGLQLYDGIDITLEKGDSCYICPAGGTKLEDLSISVTGNVLKVKKISGKKYEKAPIIKIVYKSLSSIEGYSKANIDSKNLITGDSVKISLRTGATLYASFDVKYLGAVIIEGCLFKADGYAVSQHIEVATKATFSGMELEGTDGIVEAGSGGIAKVNIEKKLNALATSGGFINYKGSPELQQKTSLGGKIVSEAE